MSYKTHLKNVLQNTLEKCIQNTLEKCIQNTLEKKSYKTNLRLRKKAPKKSYKTHLKKMYKKGTCHGCDKSTNRGLISEDRSTEATLLFTIPRSCLSRLQKIYLWKN